MVQKIFETPRWILAVFSLSLLIVLMIFSYFEGIKQQRIVERLLENPSTSNQAEIKLGFLKIDRVNDLDINGYDSQRRYSLIRTPSMSIREGETYSFIGKIMTTGSIKILRMQHHPFRIYKYLISGSAMIFVLVLILKNIRVIKEGKYLTIKNA